MSRLQQIEELNEMLLQDMPAAKSEAAAFPQTKEEQRRLLRSLMNVRSPRLPLSPAFLQAQDALLSQELDEKGVVDVNALPATAADARLVLWQGDITRLAADAIVNAANSGLTGCYMACHACIDNCIHSAAGLALRAECAAIMRAQGHEEPTGQAKITAGYNLPAKHVLHTVGPIVYGQVTQHDCARLAACYRACLALAAQNGLTSVAFCCISTGEFHFPNDKAAQIAVETVRGFLDETNSNIKVIFNVFKDVDYELYRRSLGPDSTSA